MGTHDAAVFVELAIQLGGPELIVTRGDTNALACSSTNCTAVWRGTLVHMSVLHQVLYLEATIERCVTRSPHAGTGRYVACVSVDARLLRIACLPPRACLVGVRRLSRVGCACVAWVQIQNRAVQL